MSGLMACAQCMSPHTAAFGLYWKNMWYMPFQKIGPLGSFIQFFAGSKWNWGRSGSPARRDCASSFSTKDSGSKSFKSVTVAKGAAHNACKKLRREVAMRTSDTEVFVEAPLVTSGVKTPGCSDHFRHGQSRALPKDI